MTHYLNSQLDINSDTLVEVIDEVPLWSAPFGIKLLDGILYKKGLKVLDIGFGAGFPLTEIAMRLGNDSTIYGIDPWIAAVERARKKLSIYGIKNVEILNAVSEDIPLNNQSIDLIVSNNGLNNVTDLDKSLSECARVLKPDGQFIQTVNLEETMIEFYRVMERVLYKSNQTDCIDLMRNHIHDKRKPLDQYLELIKSHGFTVESVTHDKFEYKFADGTAMLNHFVIRLAFLGSWQAIVPKNRHEETFRMIENELNQIAQADGCLKMGVPFVMIDCGNR